MGQGKRQRAMALVLVIVCAMSGRQALSAPKASKPDAQIWTYRDIGRIQWTEPVDGNFYFAVPDFTAGARIKCSRAFVTDCEIQVSTRDLTIDLAQRKAELLQQLKPLFSDAVESRPGIETYGAAPPVDYVVLTNKKDGGKLAAGFFVSGPFVAKFRFMARDADGAKLARLLKLVHSAAALDADAYLAFKLADFKAACDELYPSSRQANGAAFSNSRFGKIDYVNYLAGLAPKEKRKDEVSKIHGARRAWLQSMRQWSKQDVAAFCLSYPRQVHNAED